jgi:predicted DNA-binding protein
MDKEAHIVVRIEPEVREKLKKLAQQEDRSVSWLVRKAIEKYLREALCK